MRTKTGNVTTSQLDMLGSAHGSCWQLYDAFQRCCYGVPTALRVRYMCELRGRQILRDAWVQMPTDTRSCPCFAPELVAHVSSFCTCSMVPGLGPWPGMTHMGQSAISGISLHIAPLPGCRHTGGHNDARIRTGSGHAIAGARVHALRGHGWYGGGVGQCPCTLS